MSEGCDLSTVNRCYSLALQDEYPTINAGAADILAERAAGAPNPPCPTCPRALGLLAFEQTAKTS